MALSRFIGPFFDVGKGIRPSSGAKLFFFDTGTAVPKDTFNCPDGTTANSNPVIADSQGVFPDIFWSGTFKVILKDNNDVQQWEADPVSSVIEFSQSSSSFIFHDDLVGAKSRVDVVEGSQIKISDREGGLFEYVTGEIANGFNIIDHDTLPLQLNLIITGSIEPKEFGMSTLVADNGPVLQVIVDHAIANPGVSIEPSAGVYLFTTGVTAAGEGADKFTMIGKSRRGIEFKTTSAIDILTLSGEPLNTFQYPTIKRIAFNANNAAASGIKTRNTELLEISECSFLGAGGLAGINMSPAGGDSDIKPNIHDNVFGGAIQIGILGGDTRQADGNYLSNFFIDVAVAGMQMGGIDGASIMYNKFFNEPSANTARSMNLKKPIYTTVAFNDFFEAGSNGLLVTSPKYSNFNDNNFVGCGSSNLFPAFSILDFDVTVEHIDNNILNNTIKDVIGAGLSINSANSNAFGYTIANNKFENVGKGDTIHDAISLVNVRDSDLLRNSVDGQNISGTPVVATQDWLSLNGSTNIVLAGNKHKNTVNPDVDRVNSPTMIIEDSRRITLDVTSTITALFDDDGMIGGVLTAGITVNLPSASSCPGKHYSARWTSGAFDITLDPAAAQTIDGAATLIVNSGNPSATIISDGINWYTL